MAINQLNNAWWHYRDAVDRFYEVAGTALGDGQLLEDDDSVERADGALADALVWSHQLSEIGEGLLGDPDRRNRGHDEISVLLIAAAAVDSMLACDGLRVSPEPIERDPRFVERASTVEAEPAEILLREADTLFGPRFGAIGGGQEVNRKGLLRECTQTLDTLVNAATDPAMRFGFEAVSTGLSPLINFATAQTAHQLGQIAQRTGRIRKHAVGLLRENVRKLFAAADEASIERALDLLRQALRSHGERLLGIIAGYSRAEADVNAAIYYPGDLIAHSVGVVRTDLGTLANAYREQMRWTNRIAKSLSFLAPLISVVASSVGVPGPMIVIGLDSIGLGFVVYTLAVRLDGYRLPSRVDGVVTLVRRLQPRDTTT